jgi:hypothetical protein
MRNNRARFYSEWVSEAFKCGLLNTQGISKKNIFTFKELIYPGSLQRIGDGAIALIKIDNTRSLLVIGEKSLGFTGLKYTAQGLTLRFCQLNDINAECLRKLLPHTGPSKLGKKSTSFGLGDRLGVASPGHIRSIRKYYATPVLAQQSLRELRLTRRTYRDVINSASWAVFQEGYRSPWGADGDHLKTVNIVKKALKRGCTMITADLSEHLNNSILKLPENEILIEYEKTEKKLRLSMEKEYLNMKINLDTKEKIEFSKYDLAFSFLLYCRAIEHAEKMYKKAKKIKPDFDFEISVDETAIPTQYNSHIFIANELIKREVEMSSLAPRFVGEFQKGIDYMGDIGQFEKSFRTHAAIARYFGYKISVHSGSDKFSIFPIIGKYARNNFHIKTSGTSWLEALHIIAVVKPELFNRFHKLAVSVLPESSKNYYITPDKNNISNPDQFDRKDIHSILQNPDDRQVLHVAYGEILKDSQLRTELMSILNNNIELYWDTLEKHIDKHSTNLGIDSRA